MMLSNAFIKTRDPLHGDNGFTESEDMLFMERGFMLFRGVVLFGSFKVSHFGDRSLALMTCIGCLLSEDRLST